jgi:signal transduction histidine kinase
LTNITVYGGWSDNGRDQQAYTVYFSTVQAPDLFNPLSGVNYVPSDPANGQSATRVTLKPVNGALARNVAAVNFNFTSPVSKNGFCGYSQIIISGTGSTTLPSPEFTDHYNRSAGPSIGAPINDVVSLGSWIWDAKTFDGQTCQFWRAFDIPAHSEGKRARLLVTADNEFVYFLDGHELGRGAEWRELFDYNLTPLVSPGRHVLAVKAFNSIGVAGMILGLRVDLADGRFVEITSDQNWQIVPNETKDFKEMTKAHADWRAATIMAAVGHHPWWVQPEGINTMLVPAPIRLFFWQTAWFEITFLTLCGFLLLTILFLIAQLALHQKERFLLQRERARIAMDIHDEIGSCITRLVLNGEDARRELPEDSKIRMKLGRICDDARSGLASIDEILWALNPRLDTLRDFANYICDYASKILEPAAIGCVFEVDAEMQLAVADLPLRRSLLMAVKETLNNIVKHSGATEARLKIKRQHQHLIVEIVDNGRGFDLTAITPGRNGLKNMSRRMLELGGNCNVSSEPGKGCCIKFSIPLKRPRRFAWFKK